MASKVAKGASPATDLATVVIWATSLPLRAPFWRDALELETDAHTSNTHSLYLAGRLSLHKLPRHLTEML
jgi:hypothetical protein